MGDMAEILHEIRSKQSGFEAVLAAHGSEIEALRRIADETKDGIRSINDRLGDLIRINERQAVQGESISRAFSQIGSLGGRLEDLAHRLTVIETNSKSLDRDREDRDRELSKISGQLSELSSQVSALKHTKEAAAAIGGPIYAGLVRAIIALLVLAATGLVGFIIRGEVNNERFENRPASMLHAVHAGGLRVHPGNRPELPAHGGNHEGDRRI